MLLNDVPGKWLNFQNYTNETLVRNFIEISKGTKYLEAGSGH